METLKKTTASRREQRAMVIEKLYQCDLNETFDFEKTDFDFVNESVEGVLEFLAKIDDIIKSHLKGYTIKRLSFVDRAIIRFAVYEMYQTETPSEIVIDEALKLTRTLTDEGNNKSVAFNNRLLDDIKLTLKG